MIFTARQITVHKGKSSINEPVILYRGDYEVSIKFTIMESKFRFKSGVNLVDSEKASYGQLAILAPYGGNVFSEVVKCEDGTVTFTLTKEMIDQLEEVGLYSFQIRLFDYYRESRVSIPPVEFGIEVKEPVASEDHDNEVNNAIVGYSIAKVVDGLNEDVGPTFDDNGQYNKTDWKTGDRISQGKLNKIEDALDQINQNEIQNRDNLSKQMTTNYNVLKAEINSLVIESGNTDAEVVLARGGEPTLNDRLNNMDGNTNDLNRMLGMQFKKGIAAHRGLQSKAPENTLRAIEEAALSGCVMCELDPGITADGVWILMHDTTIDRTTNGSGAVSSMTYSDILGYKIDTPAELIDPEEIIRVPRFEDAVATSAYYNIGINIDGGKFNWDYDKAKYVYDLLKKYNLLGQSCISLPNPNDRDVFIKNFPDLTICISTTSGALDSVLAAYGNYNIIVALQTNVTTNDIAKCHSLNIPVYMWDAHNTHNAYKFLDMGVDFVETNYILPTGRLK